MTYALGVIAAIGFFFWLVGPFQKGREPDYVALAIYFLAGTIALAAIHLSH